MSATGGHGGIIGNISHTGRIPLTYVPVFKHTYLSDLKLTKLPNSVKAAKKGPGGIELVDVAVKDANGKLLGKRYSGRHHLDRRQLSREWTSATIPSLEHDLIASIEHKLGLGILTGFVIQGLVPYGTTPSQARHKCMLKAAFSGIPVAKVGRGAPMGFSDPHEFQIAATNLTATKARILLMACLFKFRQLSRRQKIRTSRRRRNSMRSARRSRKSSRCSTRTECRSRLGNEFVALNGDSDLGPLSPVAEAEVSCALRLRLA